MCARLRDLDGDDVDNEVDLDSECREGFDVERRGRGMLISVYRGCSYSICSLFSESSAGAWRRC